MRVKVLILTIVAGLLGVHASSAPVGAQPSIPPLPADLLFVPTITGGEVYFSRNTILRVDAETLEVSPFYVDDQAWELMPISWSPQGDLLVIYRIMPGDKPYSYSTSPRQLCILNRSGALQRCLDDGPPVHYADRPEDWQNYYPVAWGPDGQTIYFDTEYPTAESSFGYGRRLVEASVLTGETLRVVYDYPGPYAVTTSADLNHISVGFGGPWYSNNPAYLLDLTTGIRLDVSDRVPEHSGLYWMCGPFSPGGQFVTEIAHYNVTRYAPELQPPDDWREGAASLILILDTQGTIQHIVAEPEGSPAALWDEECPSWQPDEQAIVFLAFGVEEGRIMRYTLADQQTTPLYELSFGPGRERYAYSPLIPSPDNTHLAFTVRDNDPYAPRQVAVLYPDGEIYRIPSRYRFGLYPLWVPPLSDQSAE